MVLSRKKDGFISINKMKIETTTKNSFMKLIYKSLIIALISIVSAGIVIFIITSIKLWSHLYTAAFFTYFLIVFGILFRIAKKNINDPKDD